MLRNYAQAAIRDFTDSCVAAPGSRPYVNLRAGGTTLRASNARMKAPASCETGAHRVIFDGGDQ